MLASVRPFDVVRVSSAASVAGRDFAAVEEPLEIRLNGTTFVVTMRTPGADQELAAGLLLSERLLTSDVRFVPGSDPNTLDVTIDTEFAARALAGRRLVTTTSACGVCGRQSIDDLMAGVPLLQAGWSMAATAVAAMPDRLRAAQAAFEQTGGLHGAALFDRDGSLVAIAEDVGRHNAVDKAIGSQILAGRMPLGGRALMVSGRTSFEIVQKAIVAGIPVLAAVSAPSSLAVELARAANLTLLGFVRGETSNIYAGAQRIIIPSCDADGC
jgi:FdhD protein